MRDNWTSDQLQNSAVLGGFLSGSLHALTGADHMVALLPLIFNRRWWIGGSIGMAWGVGHSMSSSSIGCLSYLMKSYLVSFSSSSYISIFLFIPLVSVLLLIPHSNIRTFTSRWWRTRFRSAL